MSVEPNLFKQILALPPEIILELVETVSVAAVLSPLLVLSPQDKIAAALMMIANAHEMLEQCCCNIDTEISNPKWTHSIKYRT